MVFRHIRSSTNNPRGDINPVLRGTVHDGEQKQLSHLTHEISTSAFPHSGELMLCIVRAHAVFSWKLQGVYSFFRAAVSAKPMDDDQCKMLREGAQLDSAPRSLPYNGKLASCFLLRVPGIELANLVRHLGRY